MIETAQQIQREYFERDCRNFAHTGPESLAGRLPADVLAADRGRAA